MTDLFQELASVIREFDADRIEYALCGALALAVHGAPRATKALDLIVSKRSETAVRTAVRRAGYVFEALPMKFSSGVEVQRWSKILDGQPLMLDVLWAEQTLDSIWSRRQRVASTHGDIWVVTRDDLITLKLTAGRPQDLADIQALTALEGRSRDD